MLFLEEKKKLVYVKSIESNRQKGYIFTNTLPKVGFQSKIEMVIGW